MCGFCLSLCFKKKTHTRRMWSSNSGSTTACLLNSLPPQWMLSVLLKTQRQTEHVWRFSLSLSLFLSLSRWFKRCNPKRMLSSKLPHGISHASLPVFDQEVHLSPAATIPSSLEITALLLLKINSATPDVWCPVSLPGSKCALHHTCWPVQKFDK